MNDESNVIRLSFVRLPSGTQCAVIQRGLALEVRALHRDPAHQLVVHDYRALGRQSGGPSSRDDR
jgi:hypothetical protein